MEPFENETELTAELRALRPEPSPSFAAELDERAAAGFPRRAPAAAAGHPLSRLRARLRTLPRRRLALSAAGAALATVLVATVVISAREPGTDSGATGRFLSAETPVPADSASSAEQGLLSAGAAAPSAAAGTQQRQIERSAEMVLGAEPGAVADDAAAVFDAVHAVDGIVLSSSVSGGEGGEAGASFELLIPSAKLGDALASFAAIDAVLSRHEATADITAPTVRSGELLRDSRARIDSLLAQLAAADTEAERGAAEAELRGERRRNAQLRARRANLQRRADLSRVSLRIETGDPSPSSGSGGGWGVDDALGDAGHLLTVAAAVAIVGFAVLAPIALIALLAWLASRALVRRARERTLA